MTSYTFADLHKEIRTMKAAIRAAYKGRRVYFDEPVVFLNGGGETGLQVKYHAYGEDGFERDGADNCAL